MEEDFFKDLEMDLADENEEEDEEEEIIAETTGIEEPFEGSRNKNGDCEFLENLIKEYTPASLSNISDLKPDDISQFPSFCNKISGLLYQEVTDTNVTRLISALNELSPLLQTDISLLHTFMKLLYKSRFAELESLIPSPLQYANVVYILENKKEELSSEKYSEDIPIELEAEVKLTKEQILVLTMSMKTSFQKTAPLNEQQRSMLFETRKMILDLVDIREKMNMFVFSKVYHVAPNLCALIGSEITSLLLSHVGGILELSQIPSCNLASIGKNKHLSHELHTSISGIRQEGYIYRSQFVQGQPTQYHKQMLRMVCAKIALAARVDAGSLSSNSDDSLGRKWRDELQGKIQKFQETSSASNVKPLPVPKDEIKKKRSGRKFRKYKEQFQLSHLRQLQNRMEFGKEEQTILDASGEEIGLGMSHSSLQRATGIASATKRNSNNSAKLRRSMKRRIEEANEQSNDFMLSLDDSTTKVDAERPASEKPKSDISTNWFSHHTD